MTAFGQYRQVWRMRKEASFNAANPEGGSNWNVSTTPGGWVDLPAVRDNDGLQPGIAVIFPQVASGQRAMNPATPIPGAELNTLGTLETVLYPELMTYPMEGILGNKSVVQTPGAAALTATTFDGMTAQALDTPPTGTEQLVFEINGATGPSASATLQVIVDGTVRETLTIPDQTITDGTKFYTQGTYEGTITLTTGGSIPTATITVSGLQYSTITYTFSETANPSYVVEQGGRPESGDPNTQSEFFPGVVFPTSTINFDRTAADGLLTMALTLAGLMPISGPSTPFQDAAETSYTPFAAWNGEVLVDDVQYCQVSNLSLNIVPNVELYAAACGKQFADGSIPGEAEVMGTSQIYVEGNTRWNDFRNVVGRKVEYRFTSTKNVNQSTPFQFSIILPAAYLETYARDRISQGLSATLGIRAVTDATLGTIQLVSQGLMPV